MIGISRALTSALILCPAACRNGDRSTEMPSTTVSTAVANVESRSAPATSAIVSSETTAISRSSANASESRFTCIPGTLGRNDTLTLRMRTPHGDYLTATQPDGSLFFIVYPRLDDPSRKFSLIPSEQFRKIAVLRLAANFRAIPWKYGRDTTEAFFSRPGKYVLWVGENLESDINHHAVKCDVLYQP
jgi:hypothetical protein